MPQPRREEVLDPAKSFVVQAPAGSGKTELLVRRLLVLLAMAEQPEEVLALTFTRKAAAEMHARVLGALRLAADGVHAAEPAAEETLQLARSVLARDRQQGWQLLKQTQRLRITTLDAFALWLAGRLPVLSGIGGLPTPVDDASELYAAAVRRLLARLGREQSAVSRSLEQVLLHLENREDTAAALISALLERREQWLGAALRLHQDGKALRQMLEESLQRLIDERLRDVERLFPPDLLRRALVVGRFAAGQLVRERPEHPINALLRDGEEDLGGRLRDLGLWQGLAALLLTQGRWRKPGGINKGLGFPKEAAAEKSAMKALLAELDGHDALAAALGHVQVLPRPPFFRQQEWQVLEALGRVLLYGAAELSLVFAESGRMDHTEVMLRALEALGSESRPEELLLKLDARIRHILVDEFQDTSSLQVELLQRLVSGWQAGDGRTLFAVGDPMQSIYGFRKADVGLMLAAAQGKLFSIPIRFRRLERNFRSLPVVVDWVNRAFPSVLAAQDDPAAGEVAYAPFRAVRQGEGAVRLHLFCGRDDAAEAELVARQVEELLEVCPNARIGILAASRTQLAPVMRALAKRNMAFATLDVLPLGEQPEVADAFNLLRMICHPGDHLAAAAVYAAPFIGVSMAGLRMLAQHDWQVDRAAPQMTPDDRMRAERAWRVVQSLQARYARRSWRGLAEHAWLALAGPACVDAQGLANVERFFAILDELDDGAPPDLERIEKRLEGEYVRPLLRDGTRIELVTIHGAKGLEWDIVLLPGLGRGMRRDDEGMLAQCPVLLNGEERLMLAPKPRRGEEGPVYAYISLLRRRRREAELRRLLYVACTRARDRLLLFGHLEQEQRTGSWRPAAGSMLSLLLPGPLKGTEDELFGAPVQWHGSTSQAEAWQAPPRKRLPLPYIRPLLAPRLAVGKVAPLPEQIVEPPFDWAQEIARAVGVALHEVLRRMGEKGYEQWSRRDDADAEALMQRLLLAEGLSGRRLDEAMDRCRLALRRIGASRHASWLLSCRHQEGRCEWPLAGVVDGRVVHVRIDRSFVDEKGLRWIVDYKTGWHQGTDIEAFLAREVERYAPQMRLYAEVLRHLESRPLCLGLYFPLLDAWRRLEFSNEASE